MLTLANRSLAVPARDGNIAIIRPAADKMAVDVPKLDLESYIQNYRGGRQVTIPPISSLRLTPVP